MTVLEQLASRLGRRDEAPNLDLAKRLADEQDQEGIRVLVGNLANDDPAIQSDCIKTLYEVGALDPALIAGHWEAFLELLAHQNNRMVWGGMVALAAIADLKAEALIAEVERIQAAIENGSVITQDGGIKVLSALAASSDDARQVLMPYLLGYLQSCRSKDLPRQAEVILPVVEEDHRQQYIELLTQRMPELSERQAKRLEKVMHWACQD